MSRYDDELQNKLDTGARVDDGNPDVRAFRKVISLVESSAGRETSLSSGFADRVVAKLVAKGRPQDGRDHFWFGAGVVALVFAFVATGVYTGFRLDLGFLNHMSPYAGLFVFGVSFVLFLHWLDKRLLHRRNTAV